MKQFLIALFGLTAVFITWIVVTTSLESSLFKEWDYLGSIPWMRATLWDFYANVLVLSVWICYKESQLWKKLIWIVLLCTLGSIATCTYLLIQAINAGKENTLQSIFTKRN